MNSCRPGDYGYGREGYAPGGYGQGYPQQQIIVQPPVEYIEPQSSDLGMGLRDSHKVNRRHPTDYGAGYGSSDLAAYGRTEYDEVCRVISPPHFLCFILLLRLLLRITA